jgi:hypothetical protein
MGEPLDFSLTTKGVTLRGFTNSADELAAYIAKLQELLPFLDDSPTTTKDSQ